MMNAATKLVEATYADEDKALDCYDDSYGDLDQAVEWYARWLNNEAGNEAYNASPIEDEADDTFGHAFKVAGYHWSDVDCRAIAERTVSKAVRDWR